MRVVRLASGTAVGRRSSLVSRSGRRVQEVVSRGVADPARIACGGHSYGAFMAANLLAHCGELFACGIARSGAYNRSAALRFGVMHCIPQVLWLSTAAMPSVDLTLRFRLTTALPAGGVCIRRECHVAAHRCCPVRALTAMSCMPEELRPASIAVVSEQHCCCASHLLC
jgi:predicted esterase